MHVIARAPSSLKRGLVFIAVSLGVVACGDAGRRPNGESCEADGECASGLCFEATCLDPDGDEDADGLTNGLEARIGTSPFDPDTDQDRRGDRAELDQALAPVDSDGDGRQDALESALADGDGDCVVDQDDPSDDAPPDPASLCPRRGVCADAVPSLRCEGGAPVCDFIAVAAYERFETRCDHLDNDCDGNTDEACALLAHYPFDAGPAGLGRDTSGHGHDGVVEGVLPTRDRFGRADQAARFAARGDVVRVRAAADLLTAPVTISFWVRPAAGADPLGLFIAGGADAGGALRSLSLEGAERCVVETARDGRFAAPACLASGRWSFVALVRTSDRWSIFVNAHHIQALPAGGLPTPAPEAGPALIIGRANDGGAQLRGDLDDLRVTAAALDARALAELYHEGGWGEVGTRGNPGRACDHVLSGGGSAGSGRYWIDPDGPDGPDGPEVGAAPFEAWCDMDLAGGGWTLAWVYGFTTYADFTGVANAVTPIPSWTSPDADVEVSRVAPKGPDERGAIPFEAWAAIGQDMAVVTNINDALLCEPDLGSLAAGRAGHVACENLGAAEPPPGAAGSACAGIVPDEVTWAATGPVLARDGSAFYAWDGSTRAGWPVHDPCGAGGSGQLGGVANPQGSVYLRFSGRPGPAQGHDCAEAGVLAGTAVIDPSAPPGAVPSDSPGRFIAACSERERAGWTQLVAGVLPSLADGRRREYLLATSGDEGRGWYRTPGTTVPWRWEAYGDLPGLWIYEDAATGALSGLDCAPLADDREARGLGCGAILAPRDGVYDGERGTTSLCQSPPGALGAGCLNDVQVWTRVVACEPEAGSLLGDGGFGGLWDAAETSQCWQLGVVAPEVSDLTPDAVTVPEGASGPSLHATNTSLYTLPAISFIRQAHLTLVAGRRYELQVLGRAAEARAALASLVDADGPLAAWAVPVGTDWDTTRVAFSVPRTTVDAALEFGFGRASTADLWLAHVALVDLGPVDVAP